MSDEQYRPKILVVDDKTENLFAMGKVLKPLNAEIFKAQSGREALSLIIRHDFALVLMDVQMPGMDGFETAELIRDHDPTRQIPIIFVTAISKEQKHVFRGYETGAVDYLFKPIDSTILVSKVKVFLQLAKKQKELTDSLVDLRNETPQSQLILNYSAEGILGLDHEGCITSANPAAEKMLGSKEAVLKTMHIHDFSFPPDGNPPPWQNSPIFCAYLAGQDYHQEDGLFYRQSGESFPVEYTCTAIHEHNTRITGGVVIFRDISERKNAETFLTDAAKTDAQTGLISKTIFLEFLAKAIARAQLRHENIAILFLSLDNRQLIADTFGSTISSSFLKGAAERVTAAVQSDNLVSRWAENEFAILLEEHTRPEDIAQTAQHILDELKSPVHLHNDQNVTAVASIGIALYTAEHADMDEGINDARSALQHARNQGGNNYQFFAAKMQHRVQERKFLQLDLQKALERNQLNLHYQPQVDVGSGMIIGMEALLRWNHPELGAIKPERAISIAEESGLISPLGEWVLMAACEQGRQWRKLGLPVVVPVSINVSTRQFKIEAFVRTIEKILEQTGISPENIEIELSEHTIFDDPEHMTRMLDDICQLGIGIAIDNFGIGTSCLRLLKRLPIDVIKIDRSFIHNIGIDENSEAIIKAVIALCRSLEIRVIGEGVETAAQMTFLQEQQCGFMQGYYFSRPLTPEAATRLLMERPRFVSGLRLG